MTITRQQLQNVMPNARTQVGVFISALNTAMADYSINTPKRNQLPGSGSKTASTNWPTVTSSTASPVGSMAV